jgi:hypothetical protein
MSLVLSFAGKYDYIPNDTASSLARWHKRWPPTFFNPRAGELERVDGADAVGL